MLREESDKDIIEEVKDIEDEINEELLPSSCWMLELNIKLY